MGVAVLAGALLLALGTGSDDFGGRIKLDATGYDAGEQSLEALLGHQTSSDLAAQLRLRFARSFGAWNVDAAVQVDARHGSAVERDRALNAYPDFAPVPEDSYWDLEQAGVNGGATQTALRVDRASVGYAHGAFAFRIGRQALTWGSGLVFHPLDLVNPFRPVATDTVYKPGTDMAYAQWLLRNGSDIQVVAVPRRRHQGPEGLNQGSSEALADAGRGTYAVLANLAGGALQWSVLLAEDRGDDVLGIGASGALGGAVWNLELVPTRTDAGTKTSALFNLTAASTFLGRRVTAFAELYHHGFGAKGADYTAADLSPQLLARLARGRSFVTGRDYLALGATWEATPLLQLMPTMILNAHDRSALFDLQLSYSLGNNATLKAGLRLPVGPRGSELGGLELAPGAGVTLGRQAQVFVRAEAYF